MSHSSATELNAQGLKLFKGIALFTPGGDLVYCIDPDKQNRWHLQLCAVLQEMLGLQELPHFLVPCYTATVDRWLDPRTQTIQTFAEACPLVWRHQALLNAVFGTSNLVWKSGPCPEAICDASVLATHRTQFPQLWQDHDLVVRLGPAQSPTLSGPQGSTLSWSPLNPGQETQGYVFRLFVSGHTTATEHILQSLHQTLEQALQQPYTLKIVDIYKHPELAEVDQISATPTLVKVWPQPVRRVVGDLDNIHKVLRILANDAQVRDADTRGA